MASEHAHKYYLGVYVEPEHVKAFQAALDREDDNCLLLDIEKTIGAHIDHEEQHKESDSIRINLFARHVNYGEHGAGVAEVYLEDGS